MIILFFHVPIYWYINISYYNFTTCIKTPFKLFNMLNKIVYFLEKNSIISWFSGKKRKENKLMEIRKLVKIFYFWACFGPWGFGGWEVVVWYIRWAVMKAYFLCFIQISIIVKPHCHLHSHKVQILKWKALIPSIIFRWIDNASSSSLNWAIKGAFWGFFFNRV